VEDKDGWTEVLGASDDMVRLTEELGSAKVLGAIEDGDGSA
jgi:hypothetical protein